MFGSQIAVLHNGCDVLNGIEENDTFPRLNRFAVHQLYRESAVQVSLHDEHRSIYRFCHMDAVEVNALLILPNEFGVRNILENINLSSVSLLKLESDKMH